jgi:ABC-type nitrate/sulfonate/bicarbonate transport system ATPase subunit
MNYHVEYRETLLKIEDVNLSFGKNVILKGVNGEIKDVVQEGCTRGQVIGLLGPSGVGKTQLFRIIAGLNQPTSGKVLVGTKQEPTHPGLVGVVAQNYPLFEHRTIFGNLMLASTRKYKDKKEAAQKVDDYLEHFGLLERRDLYPSQISGGQRQRIAIIQQILCSEHFLLMDEPFSGLDLLMLEKVEELINEIATLDELNTVIVVTHDVTAACSVSDTLWLMGRDRDAAGNIIPGARVKYIYDLIERQLCWDSEVRKQTRFLEFTREVKEQFKLL